MISSENQSTALASDSKEKEATPYQTAWRKAWNMFPFLAFCWASLLIVASIEGTVFYLVYPRLSSLSPTANLIVAGILILFFLILAYGERRVLEHFTPAGLPALVVQHQPQMFWQENFLTYR